MSNRKIQTKLDSPNLGGRVEVKLKDGKTGCIKQISIGNNALSKANKVRVAFIAGQYLNDQNISPMGRTIIIGNDGIVKDSSDRLFCADNNKQRNIVLLNLGDSLNTEEYIPIYEVDGSLNTADIIRGWFNSCNAKTGNPYLGINVANSPIQSIKRKMSMSETRGYFDTNKAIGHITHVAIMPGIGDPLTLTPNYSGFSVWQSLAANAINSFIIPCGITGVTGADEILVYSPGQDGECYKINLNTGAMEQSSKLLKDVTGWSDSDYIKSFKKVADNKLVYIKAQWVYCIEYDGAGKPNMDHNWGVNQSADNLGLFELSTDAGNVYACSWYSSLDKIVYNKINISTYENINLSDEDAKALIGGLPNKWKGQEAKVGIIGNNSDKYYVLNYETNEVIITTNPKDICSGIVGTMTYPGRGFSLFDSSAMKGIMHINSPANTQDVIISNVYKKSNSMTPTEHATGFKIDQIKMPWISYGYYSNWYNLYKLSAPIDKTETDTIDVSYAIGYRE